MATDVEAAKPVEKILDTPHLADALESDRFRQFLDHVPLAVAVSELHPAERVTYANIEFERLAGQAAAEIEGRTWESVTVGAAVAKDGRQLSQAIVSDEDYVGAFEIEHGDGPVAFDAWSNIIQDDDGTPMFRLVALAGIARRGLPDPDDLERLIREKDTMLRELQHRVKNNLQMITALIRLETRSLPDQATAQRFDRLAGRVNSLALLYQSLSEVPSAETVDLGAYLSQIASAVMQAHAVEGIRLDLRVDSWPVSVNVAMPTGLVANEVLTNALKHAFTGRAGGTITLHSLVDDDGCRITIADDGIGFDEGIEWPNRGKLGALIVQSLRQNANARVDVESSPDKGVRVTILLPRTPAAPTKP